MADEEIKVELKTKNTMEYVVNLIQKEAMLNRENIENFYINRIHKIFLCAQHRAGENKK